MTENDELQVYRGKNYVITDGIEVRHPTLDEIQEYGEREYYSLISSLTATPTDLMYQLHCEGIDFEEITDYELFCKMYHIFSKDRTWILLGDLDIASMDLCINNKNDEIVLANADRTIIIDRHIHKLLADYLRKVHGFKKNERKAGNAQTKRIMIEDAAEEYRKQKDKHYKSILQPLMSSLVGSDLTHENYNGLWEMKINVFMDMVGRSQKVMNHRNVMQGIYTGNIDFKKINKDELIWNGRLEDND